MGIFSTSHCKKILHNKFLLLIGDSVQRSIYKDLIVLYHENRFLKEKELRAKGEKTFLGDRLVDRSELTNGVHYKEEREFKSDHLLIRFYFATRIYNDYIETILKKYENDNEFVPDVIFINSCLWDITRYGKKGWSEYQANLGKFCSRIDEIVPADTCIIWRTTLPVSRSAKGGFLSGNAAKKRDSLVVDILLANYLAYAVVAKHKYDVLDMHFMFAEQQQRRVMDGIHWNSFAHRRMSNIFLTHLSEAWGLGVPHHFVTDYSLYEFDSKDISMNTTDVLKCAYPSSVDGEYKQKPAIDITYKRSIEERYGGPIRSSVEMYQYYNNFYYPTQSSNSYWFGQENVGKSFGFDPYAQTAASLAEDHGVCQRRNAPLRPNNYASKHECDLALNTNTLRKVNLVPLNRINLGLKINVPEREYQWPDSNRHKGKVSRRKARNRKPY